MEDLVITKYKEVTLAEIYVATHIGMYCVVFSSDK